MCIRDRDAGDQHGLAVLDAERRRTVGVFVEQLRRARRARLALVWLRPPVLADPQRGWRTHLAANVALDESVCRVRGVVGIAGNRNERGVGVAAARAAAFEAMRRHRPAADVKHADWT